MPDLPSGTVTFLFTDIEGSTRLWEQHPETMRAALYRHNAILGQAIEENNGAVFKTVGDAYCASFATAPDALAAALEAQQALAAEIWPEPVVIRVRMGLHTGAVEARDGDYFGPPLNRVARLMGIGQGGQTLLSQATHELVRDALPNRASLIDLGSHRLKDLGRPEQIYQLVFPGLASEFAPLKSLDNPELRNNLPQQLTSFIGREREMAEVQALLHKTRLLTLTGPGGTGKTRLSLQAVADLLTGDGSDGVWLVELAPIADPQLVASEIASVLDITEVPGKPALRTLTDALKTRHLWIVLDNCEHLLQACATVADALLRACPGVRIVASSREPLGVPGEQVYHVPTLALPNPKDKQTVATVSVYAAVQLFTERAKLVQPTFEVTEANAPAVAQVCWRLDGIPLAIELAAARVRSLPIDQIMLRLDDRFRLLTGGARTLLPRQQTLQALIDWSYDLLSDKEKAILQRLSVFAGGWSLGAAEAVCADADEDIEAWEILDRLTELVDKSLIVYEEVGGEGRYRLLESIRQYAQNHLRSNPAEGAVRRRHRDYFMALIEEIEPLLGGPNQGVLLDQLETEHDNFRAALTFCGLSDDGAEPGLRIAGYMAWFWMVRGYLAEGRRQMEAVLNRPEAQAPTDHRAKALVGAGNLAFDQADFPSAKAFYEAGRAIKESLGGPNDTAGSLANLGIVAQVMGELDTADAYFQESLRQFQAKGDEWAIAGLIGNLGVVAYLRDDLPEALARQEESLALRQKIGDSRGVALTRHNLGHIHRVLGDTDMARKQMGESLTVRQQLGEPFGVAQSLEGFASIAFTANDFVRASCLAGAADALREKIGSPRVANDDDADLAYADLLDAMMGEPEIAAARAAGRAMTTERAVEYALADAPS